MAKNRYCDFRCWEAKGSICRCHCRGKNHGLSNKPPDEGDPVVAELLDDPDIRKYGFTANQYLSKLREMLEAGRITLADLTDENPLDAII